ncbi:MAG: class I SAM-dependent methyltransferase [Candidatus Woykebacteria bacterium]
MQKSELIKENLKEIYNRLASGWTAQATWGHEGIQKFIRSVGKGRVLDLGCGSGIQAKLLQDAGFEVVGVDFAERMIKEAKKKVPGPEFLVMDILNLSFPANSFDGIFARASLLHIKKKDIGQVLEKLNEILKGNGIIYIALKEGEGEREVSHPERGTRFFAFYRKAEIKRLLEEAGFEVLDAFFEKIKDINWLQLIARKVEKWAVNLYH